MSTVSTKSGKKQAARKKQSGQSGKGKQTKFVSAPLLSPELSERGWRISAIVILVVGAVLRLVSLTLVPLHHDEGVNGNFLVSLVRDGRYTYDPNNYHGPTLYYFSAIIPWIVRFTAGKAASDNYGLTTFNIRLVTVAFGVATIWLVLLLRKPLGKIGSLSAAALIAISPGAVYLSRYFIHETLFVFFTLGIVVACLNYFDTGRSVHLILAAISAALMVATKETWIMNGPVLLIALVTTTLYFILRERFGRKRNPSELSLNDRWNQISERLGGPVSIVTVLLFAFSVFIVVNVLFYSSFFTNFPKGVHDALQTLNLWRRRTHEHEHSWYQYIYWLLQEEGIVLVLGGLGALIGLWRADNRLALFLAQWSFGLLAAYSLVGYKTPWIVLNFSVPLALTSGYTLDVFYQKLREYQQPRLFIALAVLIVAFCGYQMYQINFVHYDDDSYTYVYAHTKREMLTMLDQIDQVATRLKTGTDTGVVIVSPDYWPLPWYFRNYKRVGYHGQIVPTEEPIIIGSTSQAEQLKAHYGDKYVLINSGKDEGAFPLRPGVDLLLYVRKDVAR